mgnify:CR=1 FL=1
MTVKRNYIVYRPETRQFLYLDEKTWTRHVHDAQWFTTAALARDAGLQVAKGKEIYVFGLSEADSAKMNPE